MALQTLIALIFAFTSTGTRESDPEKGQEILSETPNVKRNSGARAHNDDEEDADEETDIVQEMHLDVDVDEDEDEDGSPPDESVSGPQTDSLQLPSLHSPDKRPSLFARAKTFMFPPSSDDLSYAPNYRCIPLITGIVIPFSILLEIPGLTGHWYIRTENYNTVQTRPNPVLLDIGLTFSMTCAVLANICIVLRFLEKRVMTMTILCIVFLSIHDIINIVALTIFGVSHRFNDGFTYGESFWMTVCSTVVSVITNVTLIIDLICTPDFKTSGSGLTRKQRTLMIMLIILFTYIAFGSLVNSFLLSLSFINALYFTVTTIETIGFGDIVPNSPGSRVFICFYAALGIVNLAVVVGMVQETVREGLHIGYLRRLQDIRERRRASRRRKNAERRWRSAVIWRLRDKGAKVWVRKYRSTSNSLWAKVKRRFFSATEKVPHPLDRSRGKRLNLEALTHLELKAAAMEAGVPLDTLLPPQFYEAQMQNDDDDDNADDLEIASTYPVLSVPHSVYGMNVRRGAHQMLTHQRLGAMAALLTRFAIGVSLEHKGPIPQATASGVENPSGESALNDKRGLSAGAEGSDGGEHNTRSSTTLATSISDNVNVKYDSIVANKEKYALLARSSFAWTLFVVFWLVGSAIFSQTEGWSYGSSIYFCFIAFTTIGYGDPAPRTPAGRSVFVVWALLGVATVSVLVSVASEAYSKRYKVMLQSDSFERAVTMYRTRTKKMYMTRTRSLSQSGPQPRAQSPIQIQSPLSTPASPNVRFHPQIPSSGLRLRTTFPYDQDNEGGEGSQQPQNTETDAPDPNLRAQDLLETLPRHVLNEARSFQEYMRYLGNNSSGTNAYVNDRLKALLDDVVGVDDMKESMKMDILRDRDYRRTLVTLNIEKSLMELMTVAEEAIAAMNDRDRVATGLGQAQEDADVDVRG
ncbi:voltage-gated potassium channel [Suillus weaverae]|nr:voltage-gated potassium channel [Suillus weaverae]